MVNSANIRVNFELPKYKLKIFSNSSYLTNYTKDNRTELGYVLLVFF
jgi:hypothetical protein